jgi:hypothetical protein
MLMTIDCDVGMFGVHFIDDYVKVSWFISGRGGGAVGNELTEVFGGECGLGLWKMCKGLGDPESVEFVRGVIDWIVERFDIGEGNEV